MSSVILRNWLRLKGRLRFPEALVYGEVERGADIGEGVWIPYGARVGSDCTIGRYSYLMPPCHLQHVQMGNFCSVGKGALFLRHQHNAAAFSTFPFSSRLAMHGVAFPPLFDESLDKGPVTIGHDVWIGAHCCIMGGVTIGTGAIIGAGAVITRDVAPYSIVAGVPGQEIRKRFGEAAIERLLATAWWEWPIGEIKSRGEELKALTQN